MKTPFLVIGYERSGTTLLRRLMSMHPALECDLVHEKPRLLLKCKNAKQAVKRLTYPTTQAGEETGGMMSVRAGQKVPYTSYLTAVRVTKHFIKLFPDASIVHVVRNPDEAIASQVRTFKKDMAKCADEYAESVPLMITFCSKLTNNNAMVCFGRMVDETEQFLGALYEWMGEKVDDDHIEKVISTRDPWEYEGRIMCGLRYFDSVQSQSREVPGKIKKLIQNTMPFFANIERRGR